MSPDVTSETAPAPRALTPPIDRTALHLALAAAGPRAVLSHEVAAALLGIELLEPLATSRLTVPRNRSRLVVPDWTVVRSDVPEGEQVATDGLRATSGLRTALDLARVLPTREALVAAESAVRRGLADSAELTRRLRATEGSGASGLRLVGELLDPSSGSVLESLLRWTLHDAGVPRPRTQHQVCDEEGTDIARVDFCWPAQRLVVETDGFAFHSTREAYRRDRERLNQLVRLGWRVLRFSWEDVRRRPLHVVGLVVQCLGAGPAAHEPLARVA